MIILFVLMVSVVCITLFLKCFLRVAEEKLYFIVPVSVNILFQFGNYIFLGYLDPFWMIAFFVGFFLSLGIVFIALMVGKLFVK
jgi:hypothetical protein